MVKKKKDITKCLFGGGIIIILLALYDILLANTSGLGLYLSTMNISALIAGILFMKIAKQ